MKKTRSQLKTENDKLKRENDKLAAGKCQIEVERLRKVLRHRGCAGCTAGCKAFCVGCPEKMGPSCGVVGVGMPK